jgi:DNA-directed RNA polymerase specialized sigma24 family protein
MADSAKSALLADRGLREGLVRFVRTKVSEADAEDIVQATLTDAVAAERSPADPDELRKWVYGIARHKVADHFRSARRDGARESVSGTEAAAESVPLSAKDLLQWAERELPAGDKAEGTLEWMLREGDGEKLEHIASEKDLDAARVRQRVSRLRRYFRERWAAQLAAVAAVIVIVGAVWWLWRQRTPEELIVHVPLSAEPSPVERAQQLRRLALEQCERAA